MAENEADAAFGDGDGFKQRMSDRSKVSERICADICNFSVISLQIGLILQFIFCFGLLEGSSEGDIVETSFKDRF